MTLPIRKATTLENELALSARFGYGIVLVLPSLDYLDESGKALGAIGKDLNVWFSAEQAGRMLERVKVAHAKAVD